MEDERHLLLISNSTVKHYDNTVKAGWLGAYKKELVDFIEKSGKKKVMFVPYARPSGMTHKDYTDMTRKKFEEPSFKHLEFFGTDGLDDEKLLGDAIKSKEYVVLIGGGNTWQLLKTLQKNGLVKEFMEAVNSGVYMVGISAGTNIFGYNIAPTNDKYVSDNLKGTAGFNALNGISITPHYENGEWYIDDNGIVRQHSGESMKLRAMEQLRLNDLGIEKILGLPVGAALEIHGNTPTLFGGRPMYLFEKGIRKEEPILIAEYGMDKLLDNNAAK